MAEVEGRRSHAQTAKGTPYAGGYTECKIYLSTPAAGTRCYRLFISFDTLLSLLSSPSFSLSVSASLLPENVRREIYFRPSGRRDRLSSQCSSANKISLLIRQMSVATRQRQTISSRVLETQLRTSRDVKTTRWIGGVVLNVYNTVRLDNEFRPVAILARVLSLRRATREYVRLLDNGEADNRKSARLEIRNRLF